MYVCMYVCTVKHISKYLYVIHDLMLPVKQSLCMYVHIYAGVCHELVYGIIHIFKHVRIYIYTYMYRPIHTRGRRCHILLQPRALAHVHTHIHTYIHTTGRPFHVLLQPGALAHVHKHIHTYIHTTGRRSHMLL
jgi:hypothetical protein